MTKTNDAAARGATRRMRVWIVVALIVAGSAYAYWRASLSGAADAPVTRAAAPPALAKSGSYPMTGKQSLAKTDFPTGATPMSSAEIVASLSDHTALLPGGFVEYYAPDGTLRGLAGDKRYSGGWQVREGAFCTLLQDSDTTLCSPVARVSGTLYWSMDGDRQANAVITVPGNPRNLP